MVVGSIASSDMGVVRVEVSGGWVVLRSGGLLPLSPALARGLAELLLRGADVAEQQAVPVARIHLVRGGR